jgi:hypothetical protein
VASAAEVPGTATDGVQRIQAVDRAIVLLKAPEAARAISALAAGQASLPRPAQAGRRVAMPPVARSSA